MTRARVLAGVILAGVVWVLASAAFRDPVRAGAFVVAVVVAVIGALALARLAG